MTSAEWLNDFCVASQRNPPHISLKANSRLPAHPDQRSQQAPPKRATSSFPIERIYLDGHDGSPVVSHIGEPIVHCPHI